MPIKIPLKTMHTHTNTCQKNHPYLQNPCSNQTKHLKLRRTVQHRESKFQKHKQKKQNNRNYPKQLQNLKLFQNQKKKQKTTTQTIICLGIESTAHTFGASIIEHTYTKSNSHSKVQSKLKDKKTTILSNIKKTYTDPSSGMIPHKVSEHHVQNCHQIIQDALTKANKKISQITLISYSQSPGIGHMLRIGAAAARSLAILHTIPIIGVNHCVAHLEIGRHLTKAKDPILVYASGANTQIIAYMSGKYRVFGETLDMGIGNFLDTFARYANLGFPGGPKIDQLAEESKKKQIQTNNSTYIELPYCVKGMDLQFGGILTNLRQKLEKPKEYPIDDLCYSTQETVFAMLTEITERALAHCNKSEIILGGGVACNKRLQEMMHIMCQERGAKAYFIENQYYVDNAAMIAWLGILEYKSGKRMKITDCNILPYIRTDDVHIHWREEVK
jgi:glycoprotease/Kae1 family metallohydrolase